MHSVLIVGFPIFLVLLEALLRTMLRLDVSSFIGPTLAASGISHLIPLTKPAVRTIESKERGRVAVAISDLNFIAFIWISVLLGLLAWIASCHYSLILPEAYFLGWPVHQFIGGVVYAFSLLMIFIKWHFFLKEGS
jgi:hypothetical protein